MDHQEESVPSSPTLVERCSNRKDPHITYKVLKSMALAYVWFCMGVVNAIVTPTMLDLTELLHVNIAQLSLGCLVSRSIGMLIGSPIGGFLADKYRKHIDLLLAVDIGVMCVSTAVVPWAPNLVIVGVLFAISGVANGGTSATGNAMVMTMWGKQASAPLQFIHGGFGIGLTVTPLFAAPFLSRNSSHNATNSISVSQMPSLGFLELQGLLGAVGDFFEEAQPSRIYIPYGICGAFGIVCFVVLLIFYCKGPPRGLEQPQRLTSRTWKQIIHPSSFSGDRPKFGMVMVIGLFFMYIGIVGKDKTLNAFITTYGVQELNLTKSTSSLLTTTFFGTYTLGRYVGMLFALCMPVYITLFATVIIDLIMVLVLVLKGMESIVYFWVLSLLFGFFAGPAYPSGLVWADRYIEVTAVVVALVDLGISTGSMISSWLGGYLYQYVGHIYVIELVLYFNAYILFVLTLLQILGYKYGARKRDYEDLEKIINETKEEGEKEDCNDMDQAPLIS